MRILAERRRFPCPRTRALLRVGLASIGLALYVPDLAAQTPLLLAGARVLEPDGTVWRDGQAILVEHGRISAIAPPAEMKLPAGVEVVDATGAFAIPGLIDLHS